MSHHSVVVWHCEQLPYCTGNCFLLQFFADADDVDTWMLDTLRLVSSEDVGHDEASAQSLVKKHRVQ